MWWTGAVFYQVYVRSFADANGDGVGDLRGITERLGHLAELGVDALWLTPFFRSPMADHGYDVADPRDVDPLFGDLAAFDGLLARAHDLGLRVTIDVVPNHTSDLHEWFVAARAAPHGDPARSRYIFRDGRGTDGSEPPNNWTSAFGGPAWTRLADGQWYLHLFTPQQPDLNWNDPAVAADLDTTMRFWLDRGVDGFRIDVAHAMAKPADLPDLSPEVLDGIVGMADAFDPRYDDDGVHELHRGVRRTLDDYPDVMAVGEIWVKDEKRLSLYTRPDELHLAFNFRLLEAKWDATEMQTAIEHSLRSVAGTGTPACWVLSNHDRPRHVTRYGGGDVGLCRARAAALLQLALPGVVYLYNGDELGLPDADLPDEALQDPIWERSGHRERGRDGSRIPLPWTGDEPPYGFSYGPSTWLPLPEGWGGLTVQAQRDDPGSTLNLYRHALRIRRSWHDRPAMAPGASVAWLDLPEWAFGFVREDGLICVVNAGLEPVALPPGDLLLTSGHLASLPAESEHAGDLALPPDTAAWLTST
ncbi:MAG: glycoside hydrolase family 13 protein [Geodermatophilaceae bacterium]|nr:glycoside hydrolase family 13 protein [Geodermatophilaceae bacterium]